ncbi:MAG TPA: DUF445 family protein [Desulfoprunum sp.]|nr:DUF445 family protein [Desulfoprunum sp.]
MPFPAVDFPLYLQYVAPPLLGAFIGYITNKVAIKMLFRPLRPWRILGFRVPMTPGVIPAKRRELAANMGEMVGDHLLTSREIGHALTQPSFQRHLQSLIEDRVGSLLYRDLGPVGSIIPQKFQVYFDIAVKTIRFQVKDHIHVFIQSPEFAARVAASLDKRMEHFLGRDIGDVFTGKERETTYRFIEESLTRMLSGPAMEQWLEEFLQHKVYGIISQDKRLRDVLPPPLQETIVTLVRQETPGLLLRLSTMLQEPDLRDRVVQGARAGVENFIASLGPMAAMARGFLKMETVEQKIRDYLVAKEDDIAAWLQSEDLRTRVAEVLADRCWALFDQPVRSFVTLEDDGRIERFCHGLTERMMPLLREKELHVALSSMLKTNIETAIDSGRLSIGGAIVDFVGQSGLEAGKSWLKEEGTALLRSKETLATLDSMIEKMLTALLNRPIGKLSSLLPVDVRDGICNSIRIMLSDMLAMEVPGLVGSLNIRQIVADKVNSLDLLRLERLLLSIMEEQFKYINLFGAILGFLIGCINLVVTL